MQTKFNYVSSGLFNKINGDNYAGYLHVMDNKTAYTEKYPSETSEPLLPTSKLAADLYVSEYNQDRVVDDTISLPYELSDIVIEPNEIVNFFTLNTKINYLFKLIKFS